MSQVLERLRNTPNSRISGPTLEEETFLQRRSFDRLNNIRNSFQRRQNVFSKEKSVPGAGINILEAKQSSNFDLQSRNDLGFDMFKRLSPFKTSMRKRKSTDESSVDGEINSPEVKVRILETGCEAYNDLDFIGKVRESSLLIGWMNGNFTKTTNRKQLMFEDKKCEPVDLDFGLNLRDDDKDSLHENVDFFSEHHHLTVHDKCNKSVSLSSDICLDHLLTDLDFRQSSLRGGFTRNKRRNSLTSLSEASSTSPRSSTSSLSDASLFN